MIAGSRLRLSQICCVCQAIFCDRSVIWRRGICNGLQLNVQYFLFLWVNNMASLNRIYERLGSIRMTEAQRREAEGALMWGEVIADVIHRVASVVRRTGARVAQGIRGVIDGLLRASTRPQRDSENLAGRSVYDGSHLEERVKSS
jgi:hypothetical protein